MVPNVRLSPNADGTYDIFLEYSKADVELAKDFDLKRTLSENAKTLSDVVSSYAKKVRIKSVKVFVSGVLIGSMALSSAFSVFAASDRYVMGYLYGGSDIQQIEYVNQANGILDVVSPSCFDIQSDGSLKLNKPSSALIENMHDRGIKVVPFLSNHWDRTAGINALRDVETLSSQIAEYVEMYQLDGVNVDIENVTHQQRDQYTELVRLLREKLPDHKEVSVAVAANPNNWQTGWHGSYDYQALAQYADHLLIMTYDEHYEGGISGPVASIGFVENSIRYALEKTSADKIVLGIPFFGRVWSLSDDRIVGKGISNKTIQKILMDCDAVVTYDESAQSVKAEFEITESIGKYTAGGTVLTPGRYVVWYEDDRSYEAKLDLVQKYNLKGAGSWALGQENPDIWERYEDWMDGEDTDSSDPAPDTPPESDPESSHREYTVQRGDSLWSIAAEQLGDGSRYTEIMEMNGLNSTEIHPGMQLRLPADTQTPSDPAPDTPPESDPESSYREYTVQRGDSLWGIAAEQLGDGSRYTEIMELNGLNSTEIHPGMQLKLPVQTVSEPTYREYTVQRGDSLWSIAAEQLGDGSRYTEIMELNGLNSTEIHPGMQLKLPVQTVSEPTYREYTVQRGDSLWGIAAEQLGDGSRYTEIIELNGLTSTTVDSGQILKLPKN